MTSAVAFEAPAERPWLLPDPALLQRTQAGEGETRAVIESVAAQLTETLGHFGVEARVINTISGPRVTQYELQLAPGTKVSRVASLRDDIAYALAATEIRVQAPIPGKSAVGVEVPNREPNWVSLGDIYGDLPVNASPLAMWIGKDITGKPVLADLTRLIHVLIAGTTGSGKSACLNSIVSSILLRATPDQVRFIMIDPKKVELSHFDGVPHLLAPVVTNIRNAGGVLATIIHEMERRYELMMRTGNARDLRELNKRLVQGGEKPLPYIVIVMDELADLMMVAPAEVEHAVIRLGQLARAVGMHLVVATQRPSVDVVTGLIKTNIPSRIAFKVVLADGLARHPRHRRRRKPARRRRHAVPPLLELEDAARPGRLHLLRGDEPDHRALARPGRSRVPRGPPRERHRRLRRGRRGRRRRHPHARGHHHGRAHRRRFGGAAAAPPAGRLRARRAADRHDGGARHHLGLRRQQGAQGPDRRRRPAARAGERHDPARRARSRPNQRRPTTTTGDEPVVEQVQPCVRGRRRAASRPKLCSRRAERRLDGRSVVVGGGVVRESPGVDQRREESRVFEIGSTLRETRVRRKTTLQQAEDDTKIRVKYIQAMENDDFDLMPSPAYVKGFLRTYSTYLGLDADVMLDEYRSRFEPNEEHEPFGGNSALGRPHAHRRRNTLTFIAVVCLLILGLLYVLGRYNSSNKPTTPPPPVTIISHTPQAEPDGARTRRLPRRSSPCASSPTGAPAGSRSARPASRARSSTRRRCRRASRTRSGARSPIYLRLGVPAYVSIAVDGKGAFRPAETVSNNYKVTRKGVVRL